MEPVIRFERPTKQCPFCAEDILAAAIKCKHCGSSLADAPPAAPELPIIPPHPESMSLQTRTAQPPIIIQTPQSPPINFRRGATQIERAAFNASMAKVIGLEVFVLAVTIGIMTKSWAIGLGLFFGPLFAFNVPSLRSLLAICFSVAWGGVGFWLMGIIAPTEPAAPFLAAFFGFALGIACHLNFFQWQEDFK